MDYVRPQNDILVNFRKIKYASTAERERRAALEYDAQKRAAVKARENEKRRVEVTPELSRAKKTTSSRVGVKGVSAGKRTVVRNAVSITERVAVEKSIPRTNVKTKEKVEKLDLGKTAAELLTYSCEEKVYASTKTVKAKGGFPIAFLVNAVVISILFIMLIGSYSQLADLTSANGNLEWEIASVQSANNKLEQSIADKIDLEEVRRIATNKYGMVPASESETVYLSLVTGDKIVVSEEAAKEEANVSVVMSGMGDFLKNLVGNEKKEK